MSLENPINGYGGYNAIEIDKGVLLFSRTGEGFKLFHDYMGLFMDNLYNPLCNNTCFNLHYIESGDPKLRERCDIALKHPENHLPLKIPVKDECFTDTSVLADSLSVKINGWEPTPDQIQKITDYVVGVHIPVRGDTFNISTLQEIAAGESYNSFLLDGSMSDFKYEKEFVGLAGKMKRCSDSTEIQTLAREMKDMASEILKRDYPDIRKELKPPPKKQLPNEYGYGSLKKNGPDCYNAIEVDKGVLLFSRTQQGKELFNKILGLYLDNFYNPACDNTYFNLHYLECDNWVLKRKCDLAATFPEKQQSEFPVNNRFYTDTSVLKYSLQKINFGWEAGFMPVNKMLNHILDGKFLPVRGDTLNISILKEIAAGEKDYIHNLAHHGIGGFKYNDDFKELADTALSYSGHIHQDKVINAMQDKAGTILKRDYPDIRKEPRPTFKNDRHVIRKPSQKKRGRRL